MRTITPRASHDPPSSKKNFKWIMRRRLCKDKEEEEDSTTTNMLSSSSPLETVIAATAKKRSSAASVAVSRIRSAVTAALIASSRHSRSGNGLGSRIIGTLYGHRRGHVHLAFQVESKSCPVVLLELATLTSTLVREMASGLVRIALECERKPTESTKPPPHRLLTEEPMWRAYCNGRKCGYAMRRDCGASDWKVLRAVEPVSMGAGVLPKEGEGEGGEGEMMYMRARFERVVGSRDSEAFYMMNPDGNGGTELSIYFLRV